MFYSGRLIRLKRGEPQNFAVHTIQDGGKRTNTWSRLIFIL